MPGDDERLQKARARKAARREKREARHQPGKAPPSLATAAEWPVYEVQVSRSWNKPGELVQILVARSSGDHIAASGFLVDLGSLGVKDALSHVLSPARYQEFRSSYLSRQPMIRADLNLAAKIIQEGIAYAESMGFEPHPDYYQAAPLLAGADPAACATPIPLGQDGKPLFIAGPYDDAPKIVRQLERAVGPGNFHYVVGMGGDLPLMIEGDAEEEFEEHSPSSINRLLHPFRRE